MSKPTCITCGYTAPYHGLSCRFYTIEADMLNGPKAQRMRMTLLESCWRAMIICAEGERKGEQIKITGLTDPDNPTLELYTLHVGNARYAINDHVALNLPTYGLEALLQQMASERAKS